MNIEESPVLHNRSIIISNLLSLVKHECLISVFLGRKKILLTSIIKVNLANNTLILDTSILEKLNRELLATPHVKFCTMFDGTYVAFEGKSITRTKYNDIDIFVMPIPHSLYWHNRRGAYRVSVPDVNYSVCQLSIAAPTKNSKHEYKEFYRVATDKIKLQLYAQIEKDLIEEEKQFLIACDEMSKEELVAAKLQRKKLEQEREKNPVEPTEKLLNVIQLRLYDISITGCSILNDNEEFSYFLQPHTIYEHGVVIMKNHGEIKVSLEIVAKHEFNDGDNKGKLNELIGFKFIDTKQAEESLIFRYIQAIDRSKKKSKLLKFLLGVD